MKKQLLLMSLGVLLSVITLMGCSKPVPQNINLVNGGITVKAGSYYEVPFSVTSNMTDARVLGSFKASGGSGNDVIVLVLDDMSYTNWVNGHQVNALYDSGQLTVATINSSIVTPGKYHLVFSNRFSVVSSKEVSTSVNLQWLK